MGAPDDCVSYRPSCHVDGAGQKPHAASYQRQNFGGESLALSAPAFHAVGRAAAGTRYRAAPRLVAINRGAVVSRAWGSLSRPVRGNVRRNPSHHNLFGNESVVLRGGAMRGQPRARAYVSTRGLRQLREQLSERDLAIIRQVAALRLMSARQIQAVHFPDAEHKNGQAATRGRQRVLARLSHERLLAPLERRIGGLRAGSVGLVVALGPIGQRVLMLDGPRRRTYEPTLRFFDHTLAISQLVVDVTVAARQGLLDLLDCQPEPVCWREFSEPGGRRVLRPDIFLALGSGQYELRWFVEVDRSSESLPTILRKCHLYADYYQSGTEQANSGVFPRVCWVVPDEVRAERLRHAIARDRQLPNGLSVVTAENDALAVLCGDES